MGENNSNQKIENSISASGKSKIKGAKLNITSIPKNKKETLPDGTNIYSYSAAFIIVVGALLFSFNILDIYKSLLLTVASLLFVILLGAFQLQNDKRISERNFVKLIFIILKKIPPLNWFSKK